MSFILSLTLKFPNPLLLYCCTRLELSPEEQAAIYPPPEPNGEQQVFSGASSSTSHSYGVFLPGGNSSSCILYKDAVVRQGESP